MVELVEVSPRDGLQNEAAILSVQAKVALIERAVASGVRRIEVASFVNPSRVPQMADAEAVIENLRLDAAVRTIGLILNDRGAERALATGIGELGLVVPVTDGFAIANQGMSAEDCTAMAVRVLARAHAAGRPAQVTLAVAFGCPFDGAVAQGRVVALARRFAASPLLEVSLADTIGIARPHEVERLVGQVCDAIRPMPVRVHFHDTHGMGVANSIAAVKAGAVTVDAAIGGTGGCPFAPGAAGNVASEDIAYAFGPQRVAVDLNLLVEAARWLNGELGRTRESAVMRATAAAATRL
ncbi:hydroxymethylglutaryl-CoA lyase [Sphingopyxis sp.]|uniref:hydroxymethylglutaryl-CoA lyase n=1 Tax=Sphingopyxis sp. TaxID=1908224 RepID=UPI003BAB3855